MIAKMHSLGYHDAEVTFTPGEKTWEGAYALVPHDRYTMARIKLDTGTKLDAADAKRLEPLQELKGQPLDAKTVLETMDKVRRDIDRNSCRFGVDLAHTALIDRKSKTADMTFALQQGPKAKMGHVVFNGQTTVNESYLQKLVPWREGDCYSAQKIEDLRGALFQSGLFGTVDIVQPPSPAADSHVPVMVTVAERPHRSIKLGATYYSDEGPGLQMGWKHRNLLGGAETLDATLLLSSTEQSLTSLLTSPFFLRQDQKLQLKAGLSRKDTDAYESKSLDLGASVSRQINKQLALSTGVNFSVSRIFDNITLKEDDFALVSFPQTASYDTRNNILDPHKGWFIEAEAEPFINTIGAGAPFFKLVGTVRRYQPLNNDTTLALRAKIGSIQGSSIADVPADERFYAGGSGSVRGYAYQSVGPQTRGDPSGGRGLAEGSIELRHKFTADYGAVAFVDAANLSEEISPDFSDAAVGAGVGLRYYTAVGPLRFDIATPLTQRDQTADQVQFYLSIGQAF